MGKKSNQQRVLQFRRDIALLKKRYTQNVIADRVGIDSGNLKVLYRKGRALVGLRQYAAGCEYLEKADEASPGQIEIQDALRQAKTLYAQSRKGEYDISD